MQKIIPRWYQTPLIEDTYKEWNNNKQNVGLVAPCGSGKTYMMGFIAREFNTRNKYVMQFAQRDVLLSQLSLSYATLGIRHNLMCNPKAKNFISNLHVEELGESFYEEDAPVCVASLRTYYNANTINIDNKIGLWLFDEAHHILRNNQAGKVVSRMENAYGLGATATFCRLDNKGLGRVGSGVFDTVVQGVTAYDLIQSGDLCKYRVVSTPLSKQFHLDIAEIKQGREYDPKETKKMLNDKRRGVVGDVVGTYKKFAMGLRGITFCQDIEACISMAQAYRDAGVSAIALSSNNTNEEIWQGIRDFKSGKVLQMVNCMLFGEGFDVPLCYCVSFVNPTKSYGKYTQEFFRALRSAPGKKYSWIFDHVGNTDQDMHGLPDHGLIWEDYLYDPAQRPKRKNNTEAARKMTTCTNEDCLSDYWLPASKCPWCDAPYEVTATKPLKLVKGVLVELTEEELEILRGQRKVISMPVDKFQSLLQSRGVRGGAQHGMVENHEIRQATHKKLRELIDEFALMTYHKGLTILQAQSQFTHIYGHAIDSVYSMSTPDAEKLIQRLTCENL